NGQYIADGSYSGPAITQITGANDVSDQLTLDFLTNSSLLAGGIQFHGGSGNGPDSVVIKGSLFETITQRFFAPGNGQTILDPFGTNENIVFDWDGVEPFTIANSTDQLIFELPAGATAAILEDADPTDLVNPGMMRLRSPDGHFEATTFADPTSSIIIRGGNGMDSILIGELDPAFAGTIRNDATALGTDGISVSFSGWSAASNEVINGLNYQVFTKGISPNQVNLKIQIQNAAPTDIQLSSSTIAENGSANTVIGTLSSIDANVGDTFSYSLVSGTGDSDNAAFSISGNQLIANAAFDFETKNSYSIRVRTTDAGGLTFNQVFTITVTNVNDAPVAVDDTRTTDEDTPFVLSQTDLKGNDTDVDTNNAGLSVVAVSGVSHGTVVLNANGTITFEPEANYNGLAGFDYTLSDGSLSDVGQVTIIVNAVNDAPFFTGGFNFAGITEDQIDNTGNLVSSLFTGAVVDVDTNSVRGIAVNVVESGNGTWQFSTNGGTNWTIFNLTNGVTVLGTSVLDRIRFVPDGKNGTQAHISFYGWDQTDGHFSGDTGVVIPSFGGSSAYSVVNISSYINVSNINDAPTAINLSSITIAENNLPNAVVGMFGSVDPDAADTFTYSLVAGTGSNDNTTFTVVGGQLKANTAFDFESQNSYSIRVRTTDAGGLTFEQALNLIVTDVNEAPQVALDNIISVLAENANSAARVKVADIRIVDDALGVESLSLVGTGTDASKFEIDNNVLYVKSGVALDFESQIAFSIQVQVDDPALGGSPDHSVAYGLTLTDVNEFAVTQPDDTDQNVDGISESAPIGSIVGITARAVDQDGTNNVVTYSLVDSAGGRFQINSTTGVITLALANLDYETANLLSVIVRATSTDGSTANKMFGIPVANVDEPVALASNQATVSGNVLSTLSNTGTWSDPENGTVLLTVTQGPGTVVKNNDGTWTWLYTPSTKLVNELVTITASDGTNTSSTSFTLNALVAVTNRQVYYKGSDYASLGGVGAALDNVKGPLASGMSIIAADRTTSDANKINYSRGLNGMVIDVAGLVATSLTAADFTFRVAPAGASGVVNPSAWANAPAPTNIVVTPGSGLTPARIRIEWADNAIQNTWLQVIVKANANTGLSQQSAFYMGHAMAEITGGAPYRVTAADLSAVHSGISNTIVSVGDPRDINKDRRVTAADLSAVQSRISNTVLLNNISVPVAGSAEEG
ncbi:MAG: Ig-like domain-containing protein, partial [Pirellula sp.]